MFFLIFHLQLNLRLLLEKTNEIPKGGLISESFLLWLKSPKKVPNHSLDSVCTIHLKRRYSEEWFGTFWRFETKPHLPIYTFQNIICTSSSSWINEYFQEKTPIQSQFHSEKFQDNHTTTYHSSWSAKTNTKRAATAATCCCGIARSLLLHQNLRQFWGFVNTWLESHPVSAASNICSNSWNRQQSTNCCSYRMEAAKVYKELWLRRGDGDSTVRRRIPPLSTAASRRNARGARCRPSVAFSNIAQPKRRDVDDIIMTIVWERQ